MRNEEGVYCVLIELLLWDGLYRYIYISYRVWKIIGEKSQGGLNSMELEDNLHSTLS